jgi:hypothetical protein
MYICTEIEMLGDIFISSIYMKTSAVSAAATRTINNRNITKQKTKKKPTQMHQYQTN